MRNVVVLLMFFASLAQAGFSDYQEVRDLTLDAAGIDELTIEAGAGSMDVVGVEGLDQIEVTAKITVENKGEKSALEFIEERMNLSLEGTADSALLVSNFSNGFLGIGPNASISLNVSVPQGMSLRIDDGAGSIDVSGTMANVVIDDGSGSIDVDSAGNVRIDDGSGSIDVITASGDVFVIDGSGSINISHVGGSVTIDDGSGGIRVADVENDLIIEDDGSGGLHYDDIRGSVSN